MAWIRLDDHIAHHPKFLKCTPTACWMYVSLLGHCQQYLTDGHVECTSVAAQSHVRRPRDAVKELIAAGLLEEVPGGYQIHDYLDFNESKAVVLEKRRVIHEIRSKAGLAGAMAKWQKVLQDAIDLPETGDGKMPGSVSSPIPSHPSKNKNKLLRADQLVSNKPRPDLPEKTAGPEKVRTFDPAIEKAAKKIEERERSRSHVRFR